MSSQLFTRSLRSSGRIAGKSDKSQAAFALDFDDNGVIRL